LGAPAGSGNEKKKEHIVPKFLSAEWVEAAKQIREQYEGDVPAPAHAVKMNLVITESPLGDGDIKAFMDSSGGGLEMDLGELDDAELTVTVDYDTAKAIFVDGNPQAGMQAFMAGKVKVVGDMTKLMAMQQQAPDAGAMEINKKIQEITE
jgi:putative sterol carrier protein